MLNQQRGFSFIEMMLALFLSGLLMTVIIRAGVAIMSKEQQLHVLARLQQKGRFLSFFFSPLHMHSISGVSIYGEGKLKEVCLRLCYRTTSFKGKRCALFSLHKTSWRDETNHKVRSFYVKYKDKRRQALLAGVMDFRVASWQYKNRRWVESPIGRVGKTTFKGILKLQWLLRSLEKMRHTNYQYWYDGRMHVNRSPYWIVPWVVYVKS